MDPPQVTQVADHAAGDPGAAHLQRAAQGQRSGEASHLRARW